MGSVGNGNRNNSTRQRSVETMDGYIGRGAVEAAINDDLRYHLGYDEDYARVTDIKIVSTPQEIEENGGIATVEVDYSVDIKVPITEIDSDGISRTYYENETDYRHATYDVNVLEGDRETQAYRR